MRRLQILMDEELDDALVRRARKERTSKSELIRRFVRQQVKPLPPIEKDPIWQLLGTVDLRAKAAEPTGEIDRVVYLEEVEEELRGGRSLQGPLPTRRSRTTR